MSWGDMPQHYCIKCKDLLPQKGSKDAELCPPAWDLNSDVHFYCSSKDDYILTQIWNSLNKLRKEQ